ANSKLATSSSIAEIGGPGLAGTLVQIAGAPFAILVDAFSFVASAVSLAMIRSPEPLRPSRDTTTRIAHEIIEGLWAVRRHVIVFPLALRSILGHVSGSFYAVLYSLYLLQDLHLDPFLLGIVISAGGVGSLVGSVFASRVIGRDGRVAALPDLLAAAARQDGRGVAERGSSHGLGARLHQLREVRRRLHREELGVAAVEPHELVVRPVLHDLSFVEDVDAI